MKTFKNRIKLIIFFLILISTFLILKNYSDAASYSSLDKIINSSTGYVKSSIELNTGDTVITQDISDVFDRKRVYCVQAGQNYPNTTGRKTYKLSQKIWVSASKNTQYQPLLYIAAKYDKSEFQVEKTYRHDEQIPFHKSPQIAVWGLISKDIKNKYFDVQSCDFTDAYDTTTYLYKNGYYYKHPNAIIVDSLSNMTVSTYGTYRKEKTTGNNDLTKDTWGFPCENAKTIYKNAVSEKELYRGYIYIFTNKEMQNFIVFGEPDIIPSKLRVKINKYDENNEKLKGSKFKLTWFDWSKSDVSKEKYEVINTQTLDLSDLTYGYSDSINPSCTDVRTSY